MTKYVPIKRIQLVREGRIENERISSSSAAISLVKRYYESFDDDDQEHFGIVMLDTKNNPLGIVKITTGTLDASLVHPREVFKPAIVQGCSSIVLFHNHPSGDPAPSREDFAVTKRLEEVGKIIGIEILDHIVIGNGTLEGISIRERGIC